MNGTGSLGVKALDKSGSTALSSGDIPAGATIVAIYDGSNFQIIAGVGGGVVLADPLTFKGVIDCSGNPNYPAADAGDVYRVSVAGKIGGASGVNVEVADVLFCIVDGTPSGDQATVGVDWTIMQANLDGAVIGPTSATDGHLAVFDGVSGKKIKDGGAPSTGTPGGSDTQVQRNNAGAFGGISGATSDGTSLFVTTQSPGDTSTKAASDGFVAAAVAAGVGVVRKVGITIDGAGAVIATGVKGSVQVDFAGTIVGWSIEADQSGSISIEVDKHSGTQTAPVVPSTTGDKISASAPVALASQQALGVGPTGVSTWTTAVAQWDSIGFNVVSATTVTRVTLYLRIQP